MADAAATATTASRETLRASRTLRPLTKEEDGTDIFHLPNGIFGFTYSAAQKEMPVFTKQPHNSFEVHRLNDGDIHMVGFTTAETKAQIAAAKGPVEAVLYPSPFQKATEIISVSVSDLQPARKAISREDGNPLKTLVYPPAVG
jgi:hypothetical protein